MGLEASVKLISKIFFIDPGLLDKTITVSAMEIASSISCVIMIVVLCSFFIIL